MAIGSPKPVTFTQSNSNPSHTDPQPMVIVGTLPLGSLSHATTTNYGTVKQAATIANQSTFADLAAATTAYNNLIAALKTANLMA
jgi:hypothetical protein